MNNDELSDIINTMIGQYEYEMITPTTLTNLKHDITNRLSTLVDTTEMRFNVTVDQDHYNPTNISVTVIEVRPFHSWLLLVGLPYCLTSEVLDDIVIPTEFISRDEFNELFYDVSVNVFI